VCVCVRLTGKPGGGGGATAGVPPEASTPGGAGGMGGGRPVSISPALTAMRETMCWSIPRTRRYSCVLYYVVVVASLDADQVSVQPTFVCCFDFFFRKNR